MNILIPMAGEGKRFSDAGYSTSKPSIMTYCRRTGELQPMVVCAALDLPGIEEKGRNIIFVDRDFHGADGTEGMIAEYFPEAGFITVDKLTEGQASTCMLAEDFIDNNEELLIAGCDNGMEFNLAHFEEAKSDADVLVFTYRHNEAVRRNPNAYGWMKVEKSKMEGYKDKILGVSVKEAISDSPEEDHAVVSAFWFRKGRIFIQAAKRMIAADDRINGEFYVDQAIKYVIELGYFARVFEIDRYIGWGTPEDHEAYQKTFEYWRGFCKKEGLG